jgi:hypothetical protein
VVSVGPDRRGAQGDRRQSDDDRRVQGRRSGNGKPFPEGSKIAKLQWSFKKSTDAPFVVDVPDAPTQAFLIEKDSKRFPAPAAGATRSSTTMSLGDDDRRSGSRRLRSRVPCGGEEQGLHLPPVPEALKAGQLIAP